MPIPKKSSSKESSMGNAKEDNRKKTEKEVIENKEIIKSKEKEIKKDKTELNLEQSKKEIYDFKEENWQDEDILDTEDLNKNSNRKRVSLSIYRKIAISFIVATILLLAFIVYLYLVKVTIHITPDKEKINTNIIIDILDTEKHTELTGNKSIFGAVKEFEITHSRIFESTGKKVISDEIIGEVDVINNYTKAQPLVASTRLLTADNQLFRLKTTVNVPAGKSVKVEIYTDNPSQKMAIQPTTFTIPGLWSGIQDKIYAQNAQPFIYQENAKRFILEADILDAKEKLKAEIIAKAEKEVGAMYSNFDKFIYKLNEQEIKETISGKVLDEAEDFEVTITAKVSVIAFNNSPIEDLARVHMESELNEGQKLIQIFNKNLEHHLDNYDINTGIASLNSFFSADVALSKGGKIFEKEKILGLTKKQLEEYLSGLPGIKNYTIEFKPGFVERVPNVIDRIEIIIE
ncbi:hypothetical protein ISS03_01070 [Patescibacteria group bacterium]|nr:hypothetical protein [Patescibacteria group bacterium]